MRKLRQRATIDNIWDAFKSLESQSIKPTYDRIIFEIKKISDDKIGCSKTTLIKLINSDAQLSLSKKIDKTRAMKKASNTQRLDALEEQIRNLRAALGHPVKR